ncbi:MAG: HPF/RaiA family ribosome-associated protein [Oligoflexia bacterium]|nr:HPF/RaiA family ribosome-associated protein [Oligoflexia bacterium]
MMKVIFKNLKKSEIAVAVVKERLATIFERFPNFNRSNVTVTLSMENSPRQVGPDLFTVKLFSQGGRFRNVILQKSSSNLYVAVADAVDRFSEKLGKFGDKVRVRERSMSRVVKWPMIEKMMGRRQLSIRSPGWKN